MTRTLLSMLTLGLALLALSAPAKEGMWTPGQLPLIAEDLAATGLELDPATLTNLTDFPMGAIISLGGCSASFVSPQGLVVTNHHCARGSVQYNSTAENNYLVQGFLAASPAEELPAAPGTRVYVTVAVEDVTERIRAGLETAADGRSVHETIERRSKDIVAECEQQAGHRCVVSSFYGGLEYMLVDRLEIVDVRLVYAPGDNIGKYGGDIDNWVWPRHTGDFAFYRAYVGPDGQPAEYAEENQPYAPAHHLKVSAAGLEDGDFIMVAGYPGRTQRYTRTTEVAHTFGWQYPRQHRMIGEWIGVIEQAAPEGSDARIKYEGLLAGLNNYHKNMGGQMEGAQRVGLIERRQEREQALDAWIAGQPDGKQHAATLAALDELSQEVAQAGRDAWHYNGATRATLLSVAQRLHRLALERQKPDAERKPGFQDRDLVFFRQSMQSTDRRYDAEVDRAVWRHFLMDYVQSPESRRVAALDQALGLGEDWDEAKMNALFDRYYANTRLDEVGQRLALMEASPEALAASDDPFMQLAIALHAHEMKLEEDAEERSGRMVLLRPDYMAAIIAWQKDEGHAAYPDANSTLRITYGTVMGGSPRDGLVYLPFTTLEGVAEKNTGQEPFDAPPAQLERIAAADYGPYALASLGSVPVNFLSDMDTTGGNSGSATLNARGELVGLLFDGTLESVNADWDFDPRTTRSIHVDTRYMLWVMEKLDGAEHLIREMDLVW